MVLGQPNFGSTAAPGSPAANNLDGPSSVALDIRSTPFRVYIADTLHNRILFWSDAGTLVTGGAADGVIGQVGFASGSANQGAANPSASSLSSPEGIAVDPLTGNLWVADTGNHRVLRFDAPLPLSGASASLVLGQGSNFNTAIANFSGPGAASLLSPQGVSVDPFGHVAVADTGNNRVLYFSNPSGSASADYVWGQNGSYGTTLSNLGSANPSADSLKAPGGVLLVPGTIWIADTANNRVLRYAAAPLSSTADLVIGQTDFISSSANQGGALPGPGTLMQPNGLSMDTAMRLFICDTGNGRVVAHEEPQDGQADLVYGKTGLNTVLSGPTNDNCTSPMGAYAFAAGNLFVADNTSHRVLIYGCNAGVGPATPTSTATPSRSSTPSFTASPTGTPTGTISPTPSISPSFTQSQTFTITPTPSFSGTATLSATPSQTYTATPTATRSLTPTPSRTSTVTLTIPPSATPYPILSDRALSYPNPAQRSFGQVNIAFPACGHAEIEVFDLLARPVVVVDQGGIHAGAGWAVWNMKNSAGAMIAPGIYYYRVLSDGKPYLGKMTVQ
jgi:sugar lactone lactonase YvrE